jgi:hypothetical protein
MVSEPSPTKQASAGQVSLLFLLGLAVDFGLARLEGVLSRLVQTFYLAKGVGLFYALNGQQFIHQVHHALGFVLVVASPLALVAIMGRPLWERRKLRRPGPGRLASYARQHPVLLERLLPWAVGLGWFGLGMALEVCHALYVSLSSGHGATFLWYALDEIRRDVNSLGFLAGSVAAIVGIVTAVRLGVRALTREAGPSVASSPLAASDDKKTFAAVAVTRSTQGAVFALALVSLVVAVCAATFRSSEALAAMVLAYVLAAMGTATLFRRVSRVAVGIDGILIMGADKTRFLGFADLDKVEARGSDVLLKHRGRTALRLQLHDTDVTRAPELAERIERAMEGASRMQREGADQLMQATRASPGASAKLASSIRGGLDYRQPAMAREQLWQLVEGPVSNADTRRVAAEALVHDLHEGDRERLRVAADRCAEPRARVALVEVLGAGEGEGETDELGGAATLMPRRVLGR